MIQLVDDLLALCRQYKVLGGWTDEQIRVEVMRGFLENAIAWIADTNTGKPSAMVLARWHDSCSMHITCIAGYRGSLKAFLAHVKTNYPQVTKLTAERDGKTKQYFLK